MAELLLLILVSLGFLVVSIALAARYSVEALIIWQEYKNGEIEVETNRDGLASPQDDH